MTQAVIVDDSVRGRATLRTALEGLGVRVVAEGVNGREAVPLAHAHRPDVLFLAVGLPDLDGISAAAKVMREAPTAIVLLTRHRDRGAIQRATAAGVMAYLLKPLRPDELGPALELAIARFREFATLQRENADLRKAMEARKVVERAKGVLMDREGLSESEAFARIRRRSMEHRVPMSEIARAILVAEEVRAGPPPEVDRQT